MAETTMSREDVLNWVRQASMLELSQLVKAIEEEFGVTAAAPMMAMAAAAPAAAAEEVVQTEFNVVLSSVGRRRSR